MLLDFCCQNSCSASNYRKCCDKIFLGVLSLVFRNRKQWTMITVNIFVLLFFLIMCILCCIHSWLCLSSTQQLTFFCCGAIWCTGGIFTLFSPSSKAELHEAMAVLISQCQMYNSFFFQMQEIKRPTFWR